MSHGDTGTILTIPAATPSHLTSRANLQIQSWPDGRLDLASITALEGWGAPVQPHLGAGLSLDVALPS